MFPISKLPLIYNEKNNTIELDFSIDEKLEVTEYAYYVYFNNQRMTTNGYRKLESHNKISITPSESGKYFMRLFLKYKNGDIEAEYSDSIFVRLNEDLIKPTNNKVIKNEYIYYGEKQIKFVFEKNESKYLVVGFSGIPKIGTLPRYNYIKTLENVSVNKMFILDDHGILGCYYLGENRDFAVERSVNKLIEKIAADNNIPKENVILFGSSKGGYASLYHGIKYGFGHVISASPQTKVGTYLLEQNITGAYIGSYIAGGFKEQHKKYLDGLLFDVVKNATEFPNIRIHVGEREMHYFEHVIPLQNALLEKGINIELDLGDYSSHSDVVQFYPQYLVKTVNKIINEGLAVKHQVTLSDSSLN